MMRILKQVPQLLLCWSEAAIAEVVLLLLIRGDLGQEPPAHENSPVSPLHFTPQTWPCSKCAGSRAPCAGRPGPSTPAPRRSPGRTPATQPTVGPATQPRYALFKT